MQVFTSRRIRWAGHTAHSGEKIRGGADKSLGRPTSQCVGKMGLFMCRIASLFLLQRLKGSISRDACNFNNMEMWAVISFFFLQGKALKEIHAILTETLGEHAPSYAIKKTGWPRLNMVIFPPVMRLILDDPKQWPPLRLLIRFTS